ncbi:MAG: ribonuclease III [Opitutae bacterium]|nr:ribonuclease III [Opitutae bacterium]
MKDPLAQLQARLTYTFRHPALLERAVTHSSYLAEHPEATDHNQRLEFLGDSVLQLILTQTLFELYPGEREGVLSKRRAALAKGSFLSRLAREIGLDACLRLSASEEANGGRARAAALEDAFEALVGALYLDSDFPTVRRLILGLYGSLPERIGATEDTENPKGRLQELIQPVHGNLALRYVVTQTTGEDHAKEFDVAVFLLERQLGTGHGSSKKVAEEAAARMALQTLLDEAAAKASV